MEKQLKKQCEWEREQPTVLQWQGMRKELNVYFNCYFWLTENLEWLASHVEKVVIVFAKIFHRKFVVRDRLNTFETNLFMVIADRNYMDVCCYCFLYSTLNQLKLALQIISKSLHWTFKNGSMFTTMVLTILTVLHVVLVYVLFDLEKI